MILWRATLTNAPWFGFGSFWARRREHAEWYRDAAHGFGGPHLYRVTTRPRAVLDLRDRPWARIAAEFGLEREDYAPGAADHELFAELAHVFAASGYQWVVFTLGPDEEWIYLGDQPLPAESSE